MAAQQLAQTRPGAAGAVFVASCLPVSEFGGWPDGVPVAGARQGRRPDLRRRGRPGCGARSWSRRVEDAELFLYPGDQHLFLDSSLPAYDAAATAELTARVLDFLAR